MKSARAYLCWSYEAECQRPSRTAHGRLRAFPRVSHEMSYPSATDCRRAIGRLPFVLQAPAPEGFLGDGMQIPKCCPTRPAHPPIRPTRWH